MQGEREVEGQVATHVGHGGAGPAVDAALLRVREHAGRGDELFGRDVGPGAHVFGRVAGDRVAQGVDAQHVGRDELVVERVPFQEQREEAGQDGDVLARPGLDVDGGVLGGLRRAGVDDHEPAAVADRLCDAADRVVGEVLVRHDRVGAHQHPGVGVLDARLAAHPGAVVRPGDEVAGLVERERAEAHR
jgi:hypothetical protein